VAVVSNGNIGAPDNDRVFIVNSLPENVEFFNGDADAGGPWTNVTAFIEGGSAALG